MSENDRNEANFKRDWLFVTRIRQLDKAIANVDRNGKDADHTFLNETLKEVLLQQREMLIKHWQREKSDELILWKIKKILEL